MTNMWNLKTVKLSGDKYYAEINTNDALLIEPGPPMSPDDVTMRFDNISDMDEWIARIQQLKELAIKYFGEDWGK